MYRAAGEGCTLHLMVTQRGHPPGRVFGFVIAHRHVVVVVNTLSLTVYVIEVLEGPAISHVFVTVRGIVVTLGDVLVEILLGKGTRVVRISTAEQWGRGSLWSGECVSITILLCRS